MWAIYHWFDGIFDLKQGCLIVYLIGNEAAWAIDHWSTSSRLGGFYPYRPSALVGSILLDLHNSSHPSAPHSLIANNNPYKMYQWYLLDRKTVGLNIVWHVTHLHPLTRGGHGGGRRLNSVHYNAVRWCHDLVIYAFLHTFSFLNQLAAISHITMNSMHMVDMKCAVFWVPWSLMIKPPE